MKIASLIALCAALVLSAALIYVMVLLPPELSFEERKLVGIWYMTQDSQVSFDRYRKFHIIDSEAEGRWKIESGKLFMEYHPTTPTVFERNELRHEHWRIAFSTDGNRATLTPRRNRVQWEWVKKAKK